MESASVRACLRTSQRGSEPSIEPCALLLNLLWISSSYLNSSAFSNRESLRFLYNFASNTLFTFSRDHLLTCYIDKTLLLYIEGWKCKTGWTELNFREDRSFTLTSRSLIYLSIDELISSKLVDNSSYKFHPARRSVRAIVSFSLVTRFQPIFLGPTFEHKFGVGYSFGSYELSTRLSVIKSPGERVRRLFNRDSRSLAATSHGIVAAKCQPVDIYGPKRSSNFDVTWPNWFMAHCHARVRSRANYLRRGSLASELVTF